MAASVSNGRPLPRLLVLSDVNVERAGGGALALYRLLCTYPPARLMVVSRPTANWPLPAERIPGATYRNLTYRFPRWLVNRLNPFWPLFMARYLTLRAPEVLRDAQSFRPEAILSVVHDYLWFTADVVARRLGVPLHLILHDDWPTLQTLPQPGWIKPSVQRACRGIAGRVFRRARTRFCVSPGMAERYADQFGIGFDVLYPCRGEDSPAAAVRARPVPASRLVVAYAGMIHQGWTIDALRDLATVLADLGGRLDLHVPYPEEKVAAWGLSGPHVRCAGFCPTAREMAEAVVATAHVLFLPASFREQDRLNVSTLFPSKTADYTAIGVPILVWGPSYSSAARWATENSGATELVTDRDPQALRAPLRRLAADPDYARQVAAAGVAAGKRDFDPGPVRARLLAALVSANGRGGPP